MTNINTEKCYDYSEITDQKIIDFSEGNERLKQLLDYCYKNSIKTNACCIGHEEGNTHPYVDFVFDKTNQDMLLYVFYQMIFDPMLGDKISVHIRHVGKKNSDTFNVCADISQINSLVDDKNREIFFCSLLLHLKNYKLNFKKIEPTIYHDLYKTINYLEENDNIIDIFFGNKTTLISPGDLKYVEYNGNNYKIYDMPLESTVPTLFNKPVVPFENNKDINYSSNNLLQYSYVVNNQDIMLFCEKANEKQIKSVK